MIGIAVLVVALAVIVLMLALAVRGRGQSALSAPGGRALPDERASPVREGSRALIARLSKPERVYDSLNTGNKINAIRAFREQLNCGLKEAKDAVELMEREMVSGSSPGATAPRLVQAPKPVPEAEPPLPALSEVVSRKLIAALPNRALVDEPLRAGSKIGAIKAFRDQSHCGLREAREAVELMERERV